MFKRDFTITAAEELLSSFKEKGFIFKSIIDYAHEEKGIRKGDFVVLRHDVDRAPGLALEMAKLENRLNIKGTYYFRTVGSSLNPNIIRQISQLGHEIGYHYEDLAITKGDYETAYQRFQEQLKILRQYASIKTISMHGVPLSPIDPKDLWDKYDYRADEILVEVYLDINYSGFTYLTDTGRGWNKISTSLRDIAPDADMPPVPNTKTLIDKILNDQITGRIALTLHPERWATSWTEWIYQLIRQQLVNIVKKVLKKVRSSNSNR